MLYNCNIDNMTDNKPKNKEAKDFTELAKSLVDITAVDLLRADEILMRKVSKLGNSGHISIPSKHIGKIAKIIINKDYNEKEEETENKS